MRFAGEAGQSPGQCHDDGAVVNVAFADFGDLGFAPAHQIGDLAVGEPRGGMGHQAGGESAER